MLRGTRLKAARWNKSKNSSTRGREWKASGETRGLVACWHFSPSSLSEWNFSSGRHSSLGLKYKYAPKKKRQKNQIKRQHVTKEPTHRQLHVSRVSLCVNSTNTHTGTQRAQITIDVQQLTSKECQWIRSSSRAVVRTSGLDMFERPLHLNFLASPFEFIDKKLRLHHPTSSLPTKKREIASRHLGPLECVFYVQQFFVQSNGKANF